MVLFAMSVVNKTKFEELARSLRESFAGRARPRRHVDPQRAAPRTRRRRRSPRSSSTPQPIQATTTARARRARAAADARAGDGAGEGPRGRAGARPRAGQGGRSTPRSTSSRLEDKVSTQINSKGLVIRLVTDKVLFDLGSSTIRPAACPLLSSVARVVNGIGTNPIRVAGHTDAIPFAGDPHGNHRLSGDRAEAVLLLHRGPRFDVQRHLRHRVEGFGSLEPLVKNDPADRRRPAQPPRRGRRAAHQLPEGSPARGAWAARIDARRRRRRRRLGRPKITP